MADWLDLLNEISSDKPCGDHLEYDPAYLDLAKNIEGKPEDPLTGEKAQPPVWRDVQKDATALLLRTKDLQVVLYLLRALIPLEGVVGLRDGLKLLDGLLEKYWECIHPVLDPDDNLDPTSRVNIIEELSNFDVVLRPLNLAALVDSKAAGRFCLRDIQLATDKIDLPAGSTKPDINIIKAAFMDVPVEVLRGTDQAIKESSVILEHLDSFVNEKVGIGNGPDLSAIKSLLKEIRVVFDQFASDLLAKDASQEMDGGDVTGEQASSTSPSPRQQAGVGVITSRHDVLKTLDLICKYYAEHEPSSPVPIFLERAKHLVTADFMQIVQNLLPDAVSQLQTFKGPDSN